MNSVTSAMYWICQRLLIVQSRLFYYICLQLCGLDMTNYIDILINYYDCLKHTVA